MVRFAKGHGTQNDFVVLPDPDGTLDLSPAVVTALCDRRAGIGGDGVLRVVRTAACPEVAHLAERAEWFMDYRNADGSCAEMCGNGVRVYARYLVEEGLADPGTLALATRGGVREVRVPASGDVTVDMGPATPIPGAEGARVLVADGRAWTGTALSMGNPHLAVAVSDLADPGPLVEVPRVDPPEAFPEGVNVEFVVREGRRSIAMRVHERGSGETRSCGTGACAAAAAAADWWGLREPDGALDVSVDVPGGQVRVSGAAGGSLFLTGPAVVLARGELSDAWWADAADAGPTA